MFIIIIIFVDEYIGVRHLFSSSRISFFFFTYDFSSYITEDAIVWRSTQKNNCHRQPQFVPRPLYLHSLASSSYPSPAPKTPYPSSPPPCPVGVVIARGMLWCELTCVWWAPLSSVVPPGGGEGTCG